MFLLFRPWWIGSKPLMSFSISTFFSLVFSFNHCFLWNSFLPREYRTDACHFSLTRLLPYAPYLGVQSPLHAATSMAQWFPYWKVSNFQNSVFSSRKIRITVICVEFLHCILFHLGNLFFVMHGW